MTRQQASSSKSYLKHHTSTTSKLDSILSSTATFLTSGISEDVPTGTTPRKKNWAVQTNWERTQPRDVLIETYRRKKAAGEVVSLPEDEGVERSEAAKEKDGEGLIRSVDSTDSLRSGMTDESDHLPLPPITQSDSIEGPPIYQPQQHQPQSRIPSGTSSLPNGIARPAVRKMPSGFGASISGKAVARGVAEIMPPPLGEAGTNVPRRTRK